MSGCLRGLRSKNSGKCRTFARFRNCLNSFFDLLNRSFLGDFFDSFLDCFFDLFNRSFLSDLFDSFLDCLFDLFNRNFLSDLFDSFLNCLFNLLNRCFFYDRFRFSNRFGFGCRSRCFRFRFCRLKCRERGEGVEVGISETCIDLFFKRIVDLVFRHAAEVILFGIHCFHHVRLGRSTLRLLIFRRIISRQRIVFRESIEIIVALGIRLNAWTFRDKRVVDRLVHCETGKVIRELGSRFIIRIVLRTQSFGHVRCRIICLK